MTRNIRGIQISISTGISKKVLVKKYWYCYWQYFFHKVLLLVLAILFETSIGIGIANTFKKYC